MQFRGGTLVIALALAGMTRPLQLQAQTDPNKVYVVRELSSIGGSLSGLQGISSDGKSAGFSTKRNSDNFHAVFGNGTRLIDLGTLGGDESTAYAVNRLGTVVGVADLVPNAFFPSHAFVWTPAGGMQDLGTFGGQSSVALGINDLGTVVGYADTFDNHSRAFKWSVGTGLIDLGSLGLNSLAIGINENGTISGQSDIGIGTGISDGVMWKPDGTIVHLPPLPGNSDGTFASSINKSNTAVGYSLNDSTLISHALLWDDHGNPTELSPLPGHLTSSANWINDLGNVVGGSRGATGPRRGVLWVAGVPHDLNDLIAPPVGFAMTYGVAIDNSNRIAVSTNGSGSRRAIILDPVTVARVTMSPAKPIVRGTIVTISIKLSAAAPCDVRVNLATNEPANFPVPAFLTIPKGATSGSFTSIASNPSRKENVSVILSSTLTFATTTFSFTIRQ